MHQMIFLMVQGYSYIILITSDTICVQKNVFHYPLESCSGVHYLKRLNLELIGSLASGKRCLSLAYFVHLNLAVSWEHENHFEDSNTSHVIQISSICGRVFFGEVLLHLRLVLLVPDYEK